MLTLSQHNSILQVDVAEWDGIVSDGRIWHTHAALALLEQGGLEGCTPHYFILRTDDGKLAAHAAAYVIDVDLLIFSQGRLSDWVSKIRKLVPGFLEIRLLECGWPLSAGPPICLKEGIHITDALGPLCEGLNIAAQNARIKFVLLRDFQDGELAELGELKRRGYKPVSNIPTTELDIVWRNYDDYLGSMRSSYRYRLRQALKLAKMNGLSATFRQNFADIADQLARQWNNQNKGAKEIRIEPLTSKFYLNAKTALGPGCQAIEVMRGTERLAHALFVGDGSMLRWVFFGRDNPGARDGSYFLAMNAIVKFAIEGKFKQVEMGVTNYQPKTDFGAKKVPLWMFVRVRGILRMTPIVQLFRLLNPVPSVRKKSVFKRTNS